MPSPDHSRVVGRLIPLSDPEGAWVTGVSPLSRRAASMRTETRCAAVYTLNHLLDRKKTEISSTSYLPPTARNTGWQALYNSDGEVKRTEELLNR